MEQLNAYNAINFNLASGGDGGIWGGHPRRRRSTGRAWAPGQFVRLPERLAPGPELSDRTTRTRRRRTPARGGPGTSSPTSRGPTAGSRTPATAPSTTSPSYRPANVTGRHEPDDLRRRDRRGSRTTPTPSSTSGRAPATSRSSTAFDPSGNTWRPQGFAFQVPRINAPIMKGDYAGGAGIGNTTGTPGPNALPPAPPGPTPSDYKAWLLNIPRYKEYGQWGFRSPHPGGANFLFGRRLGQVHQGLGRPRHLPGDRHPRRPARSSAATRIERLVTNPGPLTRPSPRKGRGRFWSPLPLRGRVRVRGPG